MSLEAAIQENTAALRELIARLTSAGPTAQTMTAAAYVATIDKPAAADVVAKTEELEQAVAKVEAAAKEEAKAALDYAKDVKPLLLKVSAGKGRDALVALLAKFGVVKGDALPASELGNVVAEIELLLAA